MGFSIGGTGYLGTGTGSTGATSDFWAYDPAANTWTRKADFGGSPRYLAVGFSIGGTGYLGTGYNNGTYYNDFWAFTTTPAITSFTPPSGPAGTSVTLTGTNLTGTTGVRFNGTAATAFAAVNATTVTATVPPGAATGAVTLATPDGVAASTLAPVLRLQAAGGSGGDHTVFLDQVELLDATGAVVSGGVANGSFETGAPAGDFTYNPTTVTPWTFAGNAALSTTASAYAPPPPPDGTAHLALLPGQGPYVEQTLALAAGTYRVRFQLAQRQCCTSPYDLGVQVSVNGVPLGALLVNPGGGYVQVVSAPFSVSNAGAFTVIPPPVLTAVAPTPGGLGQSITLTGTGLGSPTALFINGANALNNILSNSGTSLVVRVPATAAASGNVSITTAGGTATLAFAVMAPPGNALAFDGANDYLRPAGTLPATGEFTLEAWVNPAALSNQFSALVLSDDFPAGAMHCQFYNNQLGFTLNGNSPTDVVSAVALPLGRWAHVAVVYSASARTVRFYLNGAVVTTGTYATAGALSATAYGVGAWLSGGSPQRAFNGKLDELRLYAAALTQAQVQADMRSTAAAVPASLALALNFDQGTPATASTGDNAGLTTLYDLSANATPATLANFALTSGNTTSNYVASYALVVPTATPSTNRSATGFTANWTAPAYGTATSYLLDVSTTPDFAAPIAGSPFATTATSYALTGLNPTSPYYYRVRALNSALAQPDQGAYSNAQGQATPLPVELSAFTATAEGPAAVRLAWATASEKNSAAFEVERSLDGAAFARLATVAAAGTSSAPRSYGFMDYQLPARLPTLYYRLKQVDADGTVAYSPVRTVALAGKAANAGLALFPNPARPGAATLTGAAPGTAVTVCDTLGRSVASATADASGTAVLALPAGLPTGVYAVRAGAQAVRLTVE